MIITKKISGKTLIVNVEGKIDTESSIQFGTEINDELDDMENLVINFAKVEYISSVGLRVILELHKRLKTQGSMTLLNVSPEIQKIFDMTGFAQFLNIEND